MESDDDVAERDPSGRYIRFNEILGKGASKTVYKAFDEVDGIEVAWSQVRIDEEIVQTQMKRLNFEVNLLKSLKHENITKCYYSWVDHGNQTVNMITELFTSGNLRQYRKKHSKVELKALKNWGMQILRGLMHLHTHSPPIIHRDLKCDNIFVNGNAGRIKIGDLGLAVSMDQPTSNSVIGTPAFMAPDLYDEEYNELVDIYSFGMCMLEMVTCELPYAECKNQAQIFKRVTSGIKPASLGKVSDPQVKQFIEKCLAPAPMRPSAAELLKDPFFDHCANLPRLESHLMKEKSNVYNNSSAFSESGDESSPMTSEVSKSNGFNSFTLIGKVEDHSSISMNLRIVGKFGGTKDVNFVFYSLTDTALSVANEMADALNLLNEDAVLIAGLMDDLIKMLAGDRKCSSYDSSMCEAEAESLVVSQCPKHDLGAQESFTSEITTGHACSDYFTLLSTCPTPTLADNDNCDDELKTELTAIDSHYQKLLGELLKMKASAVEDAKRKWISRKIPNGA